MEVVGQLLMGMVLWLLALTVVANANYMFNCKFSNEGCESDAECCSGTCVQAHPGTNHRCTRSSLDRPCLYSYQCEERLTCGPLNTCCSKYWGTCSGHEDCCHPDLRCLEAEGFYYKRCLLGPVPGSSGVGRVKRSLGWWSLWPLLACMAWTRWAVGVMMVGVEGVPGEQRYRR